MRIIKNVVAVLFILAVIACFVLAVFFKNSWAAMGIVVMWITARIGEAYTKHKHSQQT